MQRMTEEKDLPCTRPECKHPRTAHTKDIRDTGMRVDPALLPSAELNICSKWAAERAALSKAAKPVTDPYAGFAENRALAAAAKRKG
jgi:hypothetical protein